MKKLFALVLVLAMALAIAVPALAATGWDALPDEEETYVDFQMVAAKYEFYGSTAAGYAANGTYYANWDDSKGIVKDTMGRVYFEAVIPSAADVAALYPGVDFSNLKVSVKITNVKAAAACTLGVGTVTDPAALTATPTSGSNKYTFTADLTVLPPTGSQGEQTLKAMYVFSAASAADVVATISITAGATALPATFLYKSVTVTAAVAAAPDTTNYSADYVFSTSAGRMLFDTTSDKIQRVFLDNGTTVYQVLVDVNGVISFKNGTNPSIQSGDTGYTALKDLYDFFMGALGFQWDGTAKYMNSALILLNLIKGATGSAKVVFPAGYQSIVDPTVQPPQTGDATTVVGFVMIALALVAAAVVTVKKVRA
jgi:hypothetical protein